MKNIIIIGMPGAGKSTMGVVLAKTLGRNFIDTLFSRPIFKSADFIAESGIPKPSAHRVLKGLTGGNILTVSREGKGKSPTIYRFSRLIVITGTSSW